MNDLKIFENKQFGKVRVVMRNNEPWFVGKDVCRVLEITNHHDALKRLDSDEKDGVDITDPIGRPQKVNVINEFGLYSLILGSRKPEARAFKRWITHDILPSIRKTGQYVTPDASRQITIDLDTLSLIVGETIKAMQPYIQPVIPESEPESKPEVTIRKRRKPQMNIPDMIRKIQNRTNKTEAEVARDCGVCTATVSNWKLNKTKPCAKNLYLIMRIYGIELCELYEGIFE